MTSFGGLEPPGGNGTDVASVHFSRPKDWRPSGPWRCYLPRYGGDTGRRICEVILSSGYSIEGEATKILEKGYDGFIQKPFRIVELSRIIRDGLGEEAENK
jgi:CheY-like chemotaxis protein